jgi:hypothetical protein
VTGAHAAALAAAALAFWITPLQAPSPAYAALSVQHSNLLFAQALQPPYSCRRLYEEQKKCAFGNCDARVLERLKRECLRDGGRP